MLALDTGNYLWNDDRMESWYLPFVCYVWSVGLFLLAVPVSNMCLIQLRWGMGMEVLTEAEIVSSVIILYHTGKMQVSAGQS